MARGQAAVVEKILRNLEKKLSGANAKASLADYIRLVQLQKELDETAPSEIRVTWIEPDRESGHGESGDGASRHEELRGDEDARQIESRQIESRRIESRHIESPLGESRGGESSGGDGKTRGGRAERGESESE